MFSLKTCLHGSVVLTLALLSLACDCKGAREEAEAFIDDPANQACQADADCEVVQVNCLELKQDYCGQIEMSAQAAQSDAWRELNEELEHCSPSSCTTCDAALIASCDQGLCRKPE